MIYSVNSGQEVNSCRQVAVVVFVLLFATAAWPQDSDPDDSPAEVPQLELFDNDVELTRKGWSQFHLAAGFMRLSADGIYSLRFPDGRQLTILDFDRAGLEDTDSSYWLSLNWRARNSRWGAWFASWRYDAVGSRAWDDNLDLGNGVVIPVGASVTSDFDATWYILEATYSFYRSETVDAGMGFGVHTVDLDTQLTARVFIDDEEIEVISGGLDTLAPLPNVLAYTAWKFAPRWMVIARVGYFSLDYQDYSGDMINAHGMVNYAISPRWSLGMGYQFVNLDLDVEKDDYTQVYDIDFAGPMAFLRVSF